MSNPQPLGTWEDPEYRRYVLENDTDWRSVQEFGTIRNSRSEPGIPKCFQRWTNGDRLAFRCLYIHVNDAEKRILANIFNLRINERPMGFVQAEEQAGFISESFLKLQKILTKFEPDIRRRWAKKRPDARRKVISTAWTWDKLAESHRPDLQSLLAAGASSIHTVGAAQQYERCHFILPHMNFEDLTTGKTLLRLLNARGRNEPSRFVLSDLDSVRPGLHFNVLPFELLNPVAIDLSSDVSSGNYGRITKQFSNHEMASIVDGSKMAVSDGVYVLEVQARILIFLQKCCELIMHDMIDKLDDDSIPKQPEPEPLPAHDQPTDGLVWAALQRPYMLPQGLVDLPGALDLAKAALDEARERVRALREDPFYFFTSVECSMEHSFDNFKDLLGRVHPDVSKPDHFFLNVSVKKLLRDVLYSALEWEAMVSLLERVVAEEPSDEYLKARPELQPQDDYFKLLFAVRYFIDNAMLKRVTARLLAALVTNPSYRDRFYRPEGTRNWLSKEPMGREPLYWLIIQAATHLPRSEAYAPSINMDDVLIEIQRLVETEKRYEKLLSTHAADTMGRTGVLVDLRSQLKSFRPNVFMPHFGPGFEHQTLKGPLWDEATELLDTMPIIILYSSLKRIIESETFKDLGKYADSVMGTVPTRRARMTKESTMAMQQAEAHLDKFWEEFDKAIGENDQVLGQTIRNLASFESRELYRTPDWVEPVPKSRSNKGKAPIPVEQVLPFGQLSLGPGQDVGVPESTEDDTAEKKEKVKTRGVADPNKAEETPVEQEAANVPPPKPVFKLKARSMKVMRLLFHSKDTRDLPGELEWREFVYAMSALGFKSVPGYGSAMRFTPIGETAEALSTGEGILIHGPHPSSKIPLYKVREHGHRLSAKYGLDSSSFEAI